MLPVPIRRSAGVFARATALHRGRDHHGGKRHLHARVDGAEHERLRPAAAGSRHPNPRGIDIRQRRNEIQGADGVPRLQAHGRLQMRFGLGTEQSPALRLVHFRALGLEAVDDLLRDLLAVGVANHVVVEHDATHASQLHAARLQRAAAAVRKSLGTLHDLLLDFLRSAIVEPPVRPVAVWAQYAGALVRLPLGPKQAAGDEEPRHALEVDLFDRVVTFIQATVDDRIERRLGRLWPQPERHQHLLPHLCRPAPPIARARLGRHRGSSHRDRAARPSRMSAGSLPSGRTRGGAADARTANTSAGSRAQNRRYSHRVR